MIPDVSGSAALGLVCVLSAPRSAAPWALVYRDGAVMDLVSTYRDAYDFEIRYCFSVTNNELATAL